MPSISGNAPSSAAMVVIRIGRKRSSEAWWIASRGAMPSLRSASSAKSIIMMAFFLTMPISRMMPMMPMHVEVVSRDQQREQRADAGRGQGREDGDRVDEALIEHAEHDVDGDDGGEDQQQLIGQRRLEGRRRALEGRDDACRQADLAARPAGSRRPPRRARRRGARLNEMVVGRELAQMRDLQRPERSSTLAIADERNLSAGADADEGR